MLRGEIPADAPGDSCCGGLGRVPSEVREARGCLHLRVTEQLPDHSQALAQGQRPRSIRVAEFVQPGRRAFEVISPVEYDASSVGRVSHYSRTALMPSS